MRCIPRLLALGASLLLASVAPAGSAEPADPVPPAEQAPAAPVAPEAWLETQRIPELEQTIFYVRCSEAVDGTGLLEIRDAAGEVKVAVEMPVAAGTGLFVWDGRDPEGERLPSDLYEARWMLGDLEVTAPLVR